MTTLYLVTKSHKSVGIAILLTLLFGSIGLFYAIITGGLIMTFLGPTFLVILFIAGIVQKSYLIIGWSIGLYIFFGLTCWLITIIWAAISVRSYNGEIDDDAKRQFDLITRLQETDRGKNPITVNINPTTADISSSGQRKIEVTTKPNLQDWLKSNPSKTINDYFAKFGR
jgi:energy-coupling factor transporter transmembrane protein EcfT